MTIRKIFFDMDGVLADFDRGVRELCGITLGHQDDATEDQDTAMWKAIAKVPHFYDRLELRSDALHMFHLIYDQVPEKCEILTGIPRPHRGVVGAGEDKTAWVRRLLSKDIPVNIVFKADKKNFCTGPDCILIDDLKANIDAWEKTGGTGILHTDAETTLKQLLEIRKKQQ